MSSTFREPHFHWFIFDKAELYNITGEDSVGFQAIDGRYPELVETAKKKSRTI